MARSIVETSVKLKADAAQFVAEFSRADNASRRSAANIDKEVEKLTSGLKKKFAAADVGKDFLKGLGVGSGFALAEQAAGAIAGFYERAAESARSIEESTQKSLEATLKGIEKRQNAEQRLATLQKQQAELFRNLDDARKPAEVNSTWDAMKQVGRAVLGFDDPSVEKTHKVGAELSVKGAEVDEAKIKVAEDAAKRIADARKAEIDLDFSLAAARKKQIEEEIASGTKLFLADQERMKRAAEQTAELAQKYRELADPALKYRVELEQINALHSDGKLQAEEAARAIDAVQAAMKDDEGRRIDSALKDFFGSIDEQSGREFKTIKSNSEEIDRIVGRSADGIADAWIDAASGVDGAWKSLADNIIRELARVGAEVMVVKPLLNSLGGAMGSTGIWGALGSALVSYAGGSAAGAGAGASAGISMTNAFARASGGDAESGVTYRVNEQGEEFFKSSVGGTIIPAGISKGMADGGSRGNVYNIDARGADAGVEERLTRVMMTLAGPGVTESRSRSSSADTARRGGGFRRAFA